MTVYYDTFSTRWGDMFLAKTEKGLCAALFIKDRKSLTTEDVRRLTQSDDVRYKQGCVEDIMQQLNAYFSGECTVFDIALDLKGTAFQKSVWDILQSIPLGEVWSYQDVAVKAGGANKVRAVGGAVGKNPVVIIVPCHRVVGKDRTLTGFSSLGGVDLKKRNT